MFDVWYATKEADGSRSWQWHRQQGVRGEGAAKRVCKHYSKKHPDRIYWYKAV